MQHSLEVFNAVRHAHNDFIGNLTNDLTCLRVLYQDNGRLERVINGEIDIATTITHNFIQVLNSLRQFLSLLLCINFDDWLS